MVKRKQKWIALPLTPEFQNISATQSVAASSSSASTATATTTTSSNYRSMTKDNNNNKQTVTIQSGNGTSSYTTSNHHRYNNRGDQQQQQQQQSTTLSASAAPYRKYNNHYQTKYQRHHQNGNGNGGGMNGNQNGGNGNGNVANIDEQRKQNMFNEDEYTKITTPRQDVLLKKKLINQRGYFQNNMGGGVSGGMGNGHIHNGFTYPNSRMIPNFNMTTSHILVPSPPSHPQMMSSTPHSLVHGQHQRDHQKGSSTTATTNGNCTTTTAAANHLNNSQSNANQSVIDYIDPNMQLPPHQMSIYDNGLNVNDSYSYYNLPYGQSGPTQHHTYYDAGKGYLYTTPTPVCVYNTYYNPSFIPNNIASVGTTGVDQYSDAVVASTAASDVVDDEGVMNAEEDSESEVHIENGRQAAADEKQDVGNVTKKVSATAEGCDETIDHNGDAESVSSSATTETVITNKKSTTSEPPFVSKSVLRLDAEEFVPQAMRNKVIAVTKTTESSSSSSSTSTSTSPSKNTSAIKTVVSTVTTTEVIATSEEQPEPKTTKTPSVPLSNANVVPQSQQFYEGKPVYYDKKQSCYSAVAAQTPPPQQQSNANNRMSSNGTLPNANRKQSMAIGGAAAKLNSPKTPPNSITVAAASSSSSSPVTPESVTTPKKSQPDDDEWVVAISSRKKRNLLAHQQKSFESVSVSLTPEPLPAPAATVDEPETTTLVAATKRKSKKTPKKTISVTGTLTAESTMIKKSLTNEDVQDQLAEDMASKAIPEINNNHAAKKSTKNQSKIVTSTNQVQNVRNGTQTQTVKNVISATDSNQVLLPTTAATNNSKESKKKAKRKSTGSGAVTTSTTAGATTPTTPPKNQSSLPCLTGSDFDSDSKTNEELGEAIDRLIAQRLENSVECHFNDLNNGSDGSGGGGGGSDLKSGTPTKITAPIKVPIKNFTHSTQFGGFGQTNSIQASMQSLPTCLTNKNVDISFKLNNNKTKEPQNRLSGLVGSATVSSSASIVTKNCADLPQSTNDASVQDNDDDNNKNKKNNKCSPRASSSSSLSTTSTTTKSDDILTTTATTATTYKMGDVTTGVCNWLNKRKGIKSFKTLQELRQMGVNFSKNVSNSSILLASAATTVTTAATNQLKSTSEETAAVAEVALTTPAPIDQTESKETSAAASLKPNTSEFLTAATNVGCTIS